MSSMAAASVSKPFWNAERRHRTALLLLAIALAAVVVSVAVYGFDYYRLSPPDRAYHHKHPVLRSSGVVGIRLGLLGVACFFGIYLYAIRKRVKPLARIGKSRNWLNVHVVLGVAAPLIITLHSGFKMRGLAGVAYWIMIAVVLSGFVGRYLYAQIPRSIHAAELSLHEMQEMTEKLTAELEKQRLVTVEELKPLLAAPRKEEVDELPIGAALLMMLRVDLTRPFRVAGVRRRSMSASARVLTLGGLLPSGHRELENVIGIASRRSWLAAKISFLGKSQQIFHLWHVVHRPFSYSFALLVTLHIIVVVLMGYY